MRNNVDLTHRELQNIVHRIDSLTNKRDKASKLQASMALLKVQSLQTIELCVREAAWIFGGKLCKKGKKIDEIYRGLCSLDHLGYFGEMFFGSRVLKSNL